MNPADLLQRIAKTLRDEVGPTVDAEYPKTQAYMASVVLQKLGRELALAETHRAADAADLSALADDLVRLRDGATTSTGASAIGASATARTAVLPANVTAAIDRFAASREANSLCDVIESLYAAREELDDARFDATLGRIRTTLRAQIDRRLEFAK